MLEYTQAIRIGERQGLNRHSIGVYLTRSPILNTLSRGRYALRGALTAAAGPVLGGWLVDQVSWRAIFFLNVPLAIAAAKLAMRFACESRDPKAKPLDWKGAVAVAIGLATITWGLGAIPSRGFHDSAGVSAEDEPGPPVLLHPRLVGRAHQIGG